MLARSDDACSTFNGQRKLFYFRQTTNDGKGNGNEGSVERMRDSDFFRLFVN